MLSLNKRWVIGSAENVTLIFVFLFPCGWHSWAYWYFLFMSSFLHSRESYLNNILCAVFSNPNRLVDKHYQDWIHGSASQHSSFIQIPSVRDQLCVCQQPNLNLYEADAADKEKLRCPQVACREELACCDQGSLCVCVRTLKIHTHNEPLCCWTNKNNFVQVGLHEQNASSVPGINIQDPVNQIIGAVTSTHRIWILKKIIEIPKMKSTFLLYVKKQNYSNNLKNLFLMLFKLLSLSSW